MELRDLALIAMRRQKVNQSGLAHLLGVSSAAVSKMVRGDSRKTSHETMVKLADLAGVKLDSPGAPVDQMRAAGASETELEELMGIWPLLPKAIRAVLVVSARTWLAATQGGEESAPVVAEDDPNADDAGTHDGDYRARG